MEEIGSVIAMDQTGASVKRNDRGQRRGCHLLDLSRGLACAAIVLAFGGCAGSSVERGGGQVGVAAEEYDVRGVVRNIRPDGTAAIIEHEAIPGYMEAMVMPFRVRNTNQWAGVNPGDEIGFRLNVTTDESWIDRIERTGRTNKVESAVESGATEAIVPGQPTSRHALWEFPFTNELNQVTRLSDFEGRALAITFIFTRCPIPEYCPRLTRNFEAASRKLATLPDAPTNWHFLSITIDPDFDTPRVLRSYGERYKYDPKRWSFLTGPKEELSALAEQSGVTSGKEGGLLNHSFRTLIIDARGNLQMSFPTSGDLSEAIVDEILKAALVAPVP